MVLFVLGGCSVYGVLFGVEGYAGWAGWQETLLAAAECCDYLGMVIGTVVIFMHSNIYNKSKRSINKSYNWLSVLDYLKIVV